MKTTKNNILKGSLIAGAFIATAGLTASASNLIRFDNLGSGSEIRTNLLDLSLRHANLKTLELTCGEQAKSDTTTKKGDSKMNEAKCGEGKCGADKKEMKKGEAPKDAKKADTPTETKTTESKTKDAKCGEGKCGVN